MKRISLIVLLVFLCLAAVQRPAFAAEEGGVTIKLATLLPKDSGGVFEKFRKEVAHRTGNQVRIKIYYGGVQGDEFDVLRKIQYKQLHGGSFTGHGLGRIVPAVRITELPYLFKNYGELSYVRSQLEETMNSLFFQEGYVVLGWYETGFAYVFSKVPITSVEVAREQKWWMWEGDPMQQATFDAMGISPVSLSLTDVMTSLSTRLIDAAATTPFGAVAFRWYTRFKFMGEYPIANGIVAVVVTREVWDKISADNRQKIQEFSKELFAGMVKERRASNDQSIEVLKKAGISVVPFDTQSEAMQFVLSAAEKARENMVGQLYTRELLDRTESLLEEYRGRNPGSDVVKIH
ncbi:MAG: TRAP transporter substrate-binding protein DctP [Thermodesulfobacteriota bacterium]